MASSLIHAARGRLVLVLTVWSLLCGCVPRGAHFTPLASNRQQILPQQQEVLIRQMDSTTLRSIRALLDLRIAHADDPVAKLRLAVVFNRPDKLRLETLPTNGFYTLGLLVSNGETTHLMEAGETQQVRSAKSPEALVRRLLGVSLGHADIFRIISGREAVIPADGQWGQQSVVGPLLFSSIAEHVQYAFDAVTLVLSTLQRYDRNTDQLLYKVEFEEFFEVGGKIFPKRGIIFLPRDNVTVWFETSMLKLNDRPAESLFSLPR